MAFLKKRESKTFILLPPNLTASPRYKLLSNCKTSWTSKTCYVISLNHIITFALE